MTLLCLRRWLDVEHLADIFSCLQFYIRQSVYSTVSCIATTWMKIMFHELAYLIKWPKRGRVKKNRPKEFKYFPRTRLLGFFCYKDPVYLAYNRKTWSIATKVIIDNSFEALLGITPDIVKKVRLFWITIDNNLLWVTRVPVTVGPNALELASARNSLSWTNFGVVQGKIKNLPVTGPEMSTESFLSLRTFKKFSVSLSLVKGHFSFLFCLHVLIVSRVSTFLTIYSM